MALTAERLAANLGLPLLEERAERLFANDSAREILGGDPLATLESAVSAIVGVPYDDARVARTIAAARQGTETTCDVGDGWRLIASPTEGGYASVVCVPSRALASTSILRRASAADAAAAVSHEVANALGAIVGWSSLARERGTLDERTEDALSLIEQSAREARSAARLLLEMVHTSGSSPKEPTDLAPVLEQLSRLILPVARRCDVEVHVETFGESWVQGSRGRLFTIAWNLVQNAVEALPPGGRVHVSLSETKTHVRLVVEDDGPGVDAKSHAHVFDPYFTTKPNGTGLGLYLVQRAVSELSGTVKLESAPDEGARFVVELPRAVKTKMPRDIDPRRRSGVLEHKLTPGVRMLIVDDDEAMCELLATALSLRGAVTTTARSAEEALAAEGPFDLALVDFGLRDARGDALIGALREQGSVDLAVLLSGGSSPPELHPKGQPDAWLRKPFELDDLVGVLVRVLAGLGSARAIG